MEIPTEMDRQIAQQIIDELLDNRTLSQSDLAEICLLRAIGWSNATIADHVGVSRTTVYRLLRDIRESIIFDDFVQDASIFLTVAVGGSVPEDGAADDLHMTGHAVF